MSKANALQIAHRRNTAAWLALDSFTDPDTINRMVEVALEGRHRRKASERDGEQAIAMRVRGSERDKSTCHMCKRKLPFAAVTLDHVIPRSKGGQTNEANLKVACAPCGNRKGDRLVSECEWLNR